MTRARKRSASKPSRRSRRGESGARFQNLSASLAEIGRSFYQRGWVFGTSGNFSAVVSERPLRLAITPTGLDKGALDADQFLEIDEAARVVRGNGTAFGGDGTPPCHRAHSRGRRGIAHAFAVEHACFPTFSRPMAPWRSKDSRCSRACAASTPMSIAKSFRSSRIARTSLNWLSKSKSLLKRDPAVHGFLLRRHGLYTWGKDLAEAKRHVEVLEFLLEILGRSRNGV